MSSSSRPSHAAASQPLTRVFLAANVAFAAYFVLISWHAGLLGHATATLFSPPDALVYRSASDYLFGQGDTAVAVRAKPLLYPLILGVRRVLGVGSIWWLQVLFLFLSANLLALTLCRRLRRAWPVPVVFVAIAAHPTLAFLTFMALADTTALLLLTLWTTSVARLWESEGPWAGFWPVLVGSLLAILKPIYVVVLLLTLAAVGVRLVQRGRHPLREGARALLGGFPLAAQILVSTFVLGQPAMSSTASDTLRGWFLPKVYARQEGICLDTDGQAKVATIMTAVETWDDERVRGYLLHNLAKSVIVFHDNIVKENLQEGTNQVSSRVYYYLTKAANLVMFYLHLFCLPFVLVFVLGRRFPDAVRMTAATVSLGLLACFLQLGVAYWQGDRYIVTVVPLWVFTYLTVGDSLLRVAREVMIGSDAARGR